MVDVSRWYASKIDTWIAVVLAFAPIVAIAGAITTMMAGSGVIVALGGVGFLAAIYLGLVFPMRYGMTDDALVVRHGLVRQRIALRDIIEVRPTNSPLSSPALSLDRLHIRFGEGFTKGVMISPAEKEAFTAELAERAGLRRQGDLLLRG
jgi:hypothetical protein